MPLANKIYIHGSPSQDILGHLNHAATLGYLRDRSPFTGLLLRDTFDLKAEFFWARASPAFELRILSDDQFTVLSP
jgi:hypothetical protein